jgi:hypothetical protein
MSILRRRSLLGVLAGALPLAGPGARRARARDAAPALQFRDFEEAVREAFADRRAGPLDRRRVEVGHCDLIAAGLQGCHNDRPFAGFPVGALRIVRAGGEPGPAVRGVRLYRTSVDLVVADPAALPDTPSRPLDFSTLPPAPLLS